MRLKPVSVSVSVGQMRELDRRAIEDYGIPSIVLMDNAGRVVSETVIKYFPRVKNIAIFCGSGNNGGDGFVAGRYLFNKDRKVSLFLIKKPSEITGDPAINLKILQKLGITPLTLNTFVSLSAGSMKGLPYDLLIDALLGTGTKGEIKGIYADTISLINSAGKPVVAVDVPSGLDADTGKPLGSCIKAKITVTMARMKKGFLKKTARKYTGKIIVADIGIP